MGSTRKGVRKMVRNIHAFEMYMCCRMRYTRAFSMAGVQPCTLVP